MGPLAALVTLVCISVPVCGDGVYGCMGCSALRHLDNGQTFFRYGGLLVIFRCNPGYKLHGYKTNSCVSGHWSRDPPFCVGSGCSNPGVLIHGTSSMNDDGSWAVFRCNRGYYLHGPSMLYCKGHTWNSTKPVCKETDMMSSIESISVGNSNLYQNLHTSVAPKSQKHSYSDNLTNAASKEVDVKFHLLPSTPSSMISSETINVTKSNFHLKNYNHITSFTVQDVIQTNQGTGRHGSEDQILHEETKNMKKVITLSSVLSPTSGIEYSTFSATHTPAVATSVKGPHRPVLEIEKAVTAQENISLSKEITSGNKVHQTKTDFKASLLPQTWLVEEDKPTGESYKATYVFSTSPTSTPSTSPSDSSSLFSSSTESNMKAQQQGRISFPSNISSNRDLSSIWTENHNLTMNTTFKPVLPSLNLSRHPLCPYPHVPAHGTFYFHNVENPGPRESKHYIQYICYPGYTLAHGDVYSFCQQGGSWSGITPVCLDLIPCLGNSGGCSQLCFYSQIYNRSSNHTQTKTQCHCKSGFILLEDGKTCQDVDECLLPSAVTGCIFGCINTPGSFHCQCPAGYSQYTAKRHCQDIDECAVNHGLGPCMQRCHNSPGSYSCSCTYGYILAGDGHSCFAECPAGYNKQPTTTPDNSTVQALKEECVDINECLEEMCEGQCINLPGSHRCICPRGYTLQKDGQRCKDINECSRKNGGCSHLCVNRRGGYKCACPASHRLSPYSWKTCLPRTTSYTAG